MSKRFFTTLGIALLVAGLWKTFGPTPAAVPAPAAETDGAEARPVNPRAPASSGAWNPGAAGSAAQPPAAAAGAASSSTLEKMREVRRLLACYESESCDYPQTDSRSYGFVLGQDMQLALRALKGVAAHEPQQKQALGEIAREAMTNPDGHVQEAALELLRELPADHANLQAVLEGLQINPADPLILDQASRELSRYLGQPEEARVHDFMASTMKQGAHFTAQQAAQSVKQFLNPNSTGLYRRVLEELPPGSLTARTLKSVLDDYEARLSGG
ncbi:MAG: hypothetical protein KF802_05190 [Bdellovibrionaceae bacterium]|nr:hypothetical protein [Pseudobdellovibrionaceae bacterium]